MDSWGSRSCVLCQFASGQSPLDGGSKNKKPDRDPEEERNGYHWKRPGQALPVLGTVGTGRVPQPSLEPEELFLDLGMTQYPFSTWTRELTVQMTVSA